MEDTDFKDRLYKAYYRELQKDKIETLIEKKKFINEVKGGLGREMKQLDTYIKKEPSKFKKFISFFTNLFKYL